MFASFSSLHLSNLKTAKSFIRLGIIPQLLKIMSKNEESKDTTGLMPSIVFKLRINLSVQQIFLLAKHQ